MSISIWTNKNPLDAVVYDHMAVLVMKHEQQIKDIAAHLLELKQLVTPMMKINQEPVAWMVYTQNGNAYVTDNPTNILSGQSALPLYTSPKHTWVGLTDDEKAYSITNYLGKSAEAWHGGVEWAEDKLREKNGG